jgi:DNA-binding transcriptional MerR regulator
VSAALAAGQPAAPIEADDDQPRPQKSQAAFRTISEVADELDVAQHVLRFWESKFPQVRPLKRGGGRRYYRPEDIELLRQIRSLLYEEGYTIRGAQKLLRAKRAKPGTREPAEAKAPAPALPLPNARRPAPARANELKRELQDVRAGLAEALDLLRQARTGLDA